MTTPETTMSAAERLTREERIAAARCAANYPKSYGYHFLSSIPGLNAEEAAEALRSGAASAEHG